MVQDVLTAIPLGFFLAFLLGPVFFVLLETAVLKGFRAAMTFDIGVILADVVFLLIAYFSTSKLLNSIKDDPALFIFGGCILTTYGIMTYLKQKKEVQRPTPRDFKKLKRSDLLELFGKGFLLNFVNIGVLGFWLGLIIVFGPSMEMQPDRLLVFFATVILTYLFMDILKILLAKKLKHKLTPTRIFRLKKIISIIIMIFGVVLIVRGVFPSRMEKIQNKVETIMPDKAEEQ